MATVPRASFRVNICLLYLMLKVSDIPVPLSEDKEKPEWIANIFLDYNGAHGIVSTTTGENFYINMRSVELKPLKRLKVCCRLKRLGYNESHSVLL